MNRIAAAVALTCTLALVGCAPRYKTEVVHATSGPARPFSPAVKANGFIFLSGQVGTDSTGKLVSGGIQAETRQTMANIRDVLTRSGSSMDKVVKCTVYITNAAYFDDVNDVYRRYFRRNPPARVFCTVGSWPKKFDVEIDCIAVV